MLLLALLGGAIGCGGGLDTDPPVLRPGQDLCANCGMAVDDARFAAAIVDPKIRTEPLLFDDLGCFLVWRERNETSAGARYYVHDYQTEEWLDARQASYLQSPGLRTPMGTGLVALAAGTDPSLRPQTAPGDLFDFTTLIEREAERSWLTPPARSRSESNEQRGSR